MNKDFSSIRCLNGCNNISTCVCIKCMNFYVVKNLPPPPCGAHANSSTCNCNTGCGLFIKIDWIDKLKHKKELKLKDKILDCI